MKTEGNEPAYPMEGRIDKGLTKREAFAMAAMQGLCVQAIPGSHNATHLMVQELPQKAVAMADALIAELNKPL